MSKNSLPKQTKLLWQLRVGILGVIPFCVFFILSVISDWFLIGALTFAVITAAAVFWYIPAYFESYEILFPNDAVIIKRGVIVKTCHIMPFSRLVYVQSISTPLAKALGLAAISLKAARSGIIIPEMPRGDVEKFISAVTKGENR